jgi:hypothetical protein
MTMIRLPGEYVLITDPAVGSQITWARSAPYIQTNLPVSKCESPHGCNKIMLTNRSAPMEEKKGAPV